MTTPAISAFQPGLFRFVQKTNYSTRFTYKNGYPDQINSYYGFWVLDAKDPYDDPKYFDGGTGWVTDTPKTQSDKDTPHVTVNFTTGNQIPKNAIRGVQANNAFQTFLMYQAPGLGSQWVPLKSLQWSYLLNATLNAPNQWVADDAIPHIPSSFSPETQEPEWDAKMPDPVPFYTAK